MHAVFRPLGIIRFYLRSEQFWDIELQSFCIPYRKMCVGNKFLPNIKIIGTLNLQNTSHNVNKLSQNKNMWITKFLQKCQIEPYNFKGTIYRAIMLWSMLKLSLYMKVWSFLFVITKFVVPIVIVWVTPQVVHKKQFL